MMWHLDRLFPGVRPLAVGLSGCSNGTAEEGSDEAVAARAATNDEITNATIRRRKWRYFDRAAVAAHPCSDCPCAVASDCRFGTFHPRGSTLNVQVKLMLMHLGLMPPSRPLPRV
jgi:hypothetical protein